MPRHVAELTGMHGIDVVTSGEARAGEPNRSPQFSELRVSAEAARLSHEREQLSLVLRSAVDGVARQTYALERTADFTRGDSQATLYKALQVLESERAVLSELSARVESVPDNDWERFKLESARALDTLRETEF